MDHRATVRRTLQRGEWRCVACIWTSGSTFGARLVGRHRSSTLLLGSTHGHADLDELAAALQDDLLPRCDPWLPPELLAEAVIEAFAVAELRFEGLPGARLPPATPA